MRHTIIAILMFLSGAAFAVDDPLFDSENVRSFVALECQGPDRPLQIQELVEWRMAGDPIDEVTGPIDTYIEGLKTRARSVSQTVVLYGLPATTTGPLKNAELAADGVIDARSLGLPALLFGCKVFPIAMDARAIRKGEKYLVSKTVFDRLAPLDQYVFRLLIGGLKPNILRIVLNADAAKGTPYERYQYYSSQGLTSMSAGDVEISLLRKNKLVFDGQTLVAAPLALTGPGYDYPSVTLTPDGRVRTVDGGRYSRMRFPYKIQPGVGFYGARGELDCDRAGYRDDGTIVFCDGSLYNSDGSLVGIANNALSLNSGSKYTVRELTDRDSSTLRRDFILTDAFGKAGEVQLLDVPNPVTNLEIFFSEPTCGLLVASNFSGNTPGTTNVSIRVPANCSALVRLNWMAPR